MKTINYFSEISDYVIKIPSINFIARAVSPLHALSIDATILYIEHTFKTPIYAAIVIAPHSSSGYVIDESAFCSRNNIFFLEKKQPPSPLHPDSCPKQNLPIKQQLSQVKKTIKQYTTQASFYFGASMFTKKQRTVFYCSHSSHSINIIKTLYDKQIHTILTHSEEGVASYIGTDNWNHITRPQLSSSWISDYTKYFSLHLDRFCMNIFHENISTKLFLKRKHLLINQKVIPFYKQVFTSNKERLKLEQDSHIEKAVIICTTAWNRNHVYDNEDLKVFILVCKYLSSMNIPILIKPHPRDEFLATQLKSLGYNILDLHGSSLENLFASTIPKAVIGISSTVLVTSKVFWNIPSFCLSKMLCREKLNNFYLKEIDGFHKTFKRQVVFVEKNEDILANLIT